MCGVNARVLFEIYREGGPGGPARVIYFTELDTREREEQIDRAMAGEHVFDGFIAERDPAARARLEAIVQRLNGGEPLDAESIGAELAGVLLV